jgi:hypothetical protein
VDKLTENDIVCPSDVRGRPLNAALRVNSQSFFEEKIISRTGKNIGADT